MKLGIHADYILFWRMPSCGMFCRVALFLHSVLRLLGTANVVPSSTILVTLMKEALISFESRFLHEPHRVTSQKTPFFKNDNI
jgi:hypothetical protein